MTNLSETTLCFFDLDKTLIKIDSYLPFLFGWLLKHPKKIFHVSVLPLLYVYYLMARKDRSFIKEAFLTAFMKGAEKNEVKQYVENFWKRFLPRHLNKKAMQKLNWHRDHGHQVYIISASFEFYISCLKNVLPVDGIFGTKAQWQNDILTGRLLGKNCKDDEKVIRLEKELGINLNSVCYYAYSDSDSDIPLLKNAAFAFKVNSKGITPWWPQK